MHISLRPVLAAVFGLAAIAIAGAAPAASPVKVRIDSGALVGVEDGGVASFKGVPYAAPPVGALRWAPPQRPAAWDGERAADKYGGVCPQPVNANGTPNAGGVAGATTEDCLYLNVWAPKGAKKAPVMLWVHGGSNTLGAGSLAVYDGSAFVHDGVILVTINYRLGPLGFFAHPALTKAAAPDAPLEAYGLMDQVAALQWVQRNITAFGGDPRNVTLFGESAGGVDTLALLAAPSAKGLFAKAIVESGGGWGAPVTLASREAAGAAAARKAGAPENATVEQLRALPVDALIAKAGGGGDIAVDGRLLKESLSQAIGRGHAIDVPMMVGSNSFEASLIALVGASPSMVLAMTPPGAKAAYADLPSDKAMAEAIFTDSFRGAPARWVAAKTSGGQPTYLYHFSYVLASARATAPGAAHASEIPFVFDSWDKLGPLSQNLPTPWRGLPTSDADRALTRLMHSCWVAFAKTGAPRCASGPAWPAYTPGGDTLMEFDTQSGVKSHFRKARFDILEAQTLPTLALGN